MIRALAVIAVIGCGAGDARPPTEQRLALIDIGTEWCAACRILERDTMHDPAVVTALAGFELVRVDGESAEARRYDATVLPTLVVSRGEHEIARLVGAVPPTELAAWLRAANR